MSKGGGVGPHDIRGLAAADIEPRLGMARAEGQARSQDIVSLLDAGKKGGESFKAEYGVEFYQTTGEKGGESDFDFYREIG